MFGSCGLDPSWNIRAMTLEPKGSDGHTTFARGRRERQCPSDPHPLDQTKVAAARPVSCKEASCTNPTNSASCKENCGMKLATSASSNKRSSRTRPNTNSSKPRLTAKKRSNGDTTGSNETG